MNKWRRSNFASLSASLVKLSSLFGIACLCILRSQIPRKLPRAIGAIHLQELVVIPAKVQNLLSLGPKFALKPKLSAPELSLHMHYVACLPTKSEQPWCLSEGVYVFTWCKQASSKHLFQHVSFLKDNSLSFAGRQRRWVHDNVPQPFLLEG